MRIEAAVKRCWRTGLRTATSTKTAPPSVGTVEMGDAVIAWS